MAWRPTSTSSTDRPLLEVGRIVKPHGVGGEVVVDLVTDRVERLAAGSTLSSSRGSFTVASARPHQGRWLVRFLEVVGREQADAVRGTVLSAPALHDPEAMWVHELIGAQVVEADGTAHGTVTAVEANPASDLLVLDTGALVPLRFVTAASRGRLTVDVPAGLFD